MQILSSSLNEYLAEYLFLELERFSLNVLGLVALVLAIKHNREVTHIHGRIRVLLAERAYL
jgi:hypothetical protein